MSTYDNVKPRQWPHWNKMFTSCLHFFDTVYYCIHICCSFSGGLNPMRQNLCFYRPLAGEGRKVGGDGVGGENIMSPLKQVQLMRLTLINKLIFKLNDFWHERAAFQSVGVWRPTGNDVSGHYKRHYFLSFFFPSSTFLIEGALGSKNLFSKSCLECPKTYGLTPFQFPSAILGPPGSHFGFCRRCSVAGSAALQAVSERPLHR